jgi:hypothetical protein
VAAVMARLSGCSAKGLVAWNDGAAGDGFMVQTTG